MEMMAFLTNDLRILPILVPFLLLSLTLHEFAHARTALAFGDPTAQQSGRITLNPLAHLDPLGTIAIIFIGFGWAKPVPVNPLNMRNRKTGEIAVSLAGPLTNLGLALIFALVLKGMQAAGRPVLPLLYSATGGTEALLVEALFLAMSINVLLCIFNLLPLYPLDGHHIVRESLPRHRQADFMNWQMKYGMPAMLAVIFGPRLLSTLFKVEFFDPLGEAYRSAMALMIKLFIL